MSRAHTAVGPDRARLHAPDLTWLAVAPAGLLIALFLALPAILGLGSTFTDYGPAGGAWHFVGLANYQAGLGDVGLRTAFANAGLLTAFAVPLELGVGLALTAALRRPFPGRSLARMLLLLPWLVSPIASGVMWHFLYNSQVGIFGWIGALLHLGTVASPLANAAWALPAVDLVEIWRMAPLAAFLLLPGVLAVPQDELDYATLVGSPAWLTWARVVVPRLRVLLLTVALLLIAQSLSTFDDILVLTGGGPGVKTITPALYSYNMAVEGHNWPQATAAAWLLAAAVLAVGASYIGLLRREVA